MTPERAKTLLPIIQAYAEGKTIQHKACGEWVDSWKPDWSLPDYRIKPEPKVIWVVEYDDGMKEGYDTEEGADASTIGRLSRVRRFPVRYIEASD